MKWRHHERGPQVAPIEPPFAVRSLVAHAPDGRLAHVITREYRVTLFDADGHEITEIRRDVRGPEVMPGEARREKERLERMRQSVASIDADFPSWEMPEGKPRGGVKGDMALGVERLEFDVQRVVVLRFGEE